MTNRFDNNGGGDQNVGQGEGAIGKQENTTQEMCGDGNIFSGAGNVTVNQGLQLRLRTVVLGLVLLAAISGAALSLFTPAHLIGFTPRKKASTEGGNAPATVAGRDAAVSYNYNTNGVDPKLFAHYAGELAVTDAALTNFFRILDEQQVPRSDLAFKMRDIAATYKELLQARLANRDPEMRRLKGKAKQAIEAGDYAEAEKILNQAEARDLAAIEELKQTARQRRISAAVTNAEQAKLQRVQLRYAEAAEYWQKAAALLPEEEKDRSLYLHNAILNIDRIVRNSKTLLLYEQSLAIWKETDDRTGKGIILNNISQIYVARGDYDKAQEYLEQSLVIRKEIGDRVGQGITLNNLAATAYAKGEYDKAQEYLEQSLAIQRKIGNRAMEGTTLNYLAATSDAKGEYATVLKYSEQLLTLYQKIGDRVSEAVTVWNIGLIYIKQGDLAKAERYISRAVEIVEKASSKVVESDLKALEEVRATSEELRAALQGR